MILDLKEKYTLEQIEHLGVQASSSSDLSKEQIVEIGQEKISSKAYPMLQTSIIRKSSTVVLGNYFQFMVYFKGLTLTSFRKQDVKSSNSKPSSKRKFIFY